MRFVSLAVCCLTVSVIQTNAAETVRNDRVAVYDVIIKSGAAESIPGAHPAMTVYFSGGALEVSGAGGKPTAVKVKRGDSVFEAAGAKKIRNTGTSEVHFARVEFLGPGIDETWGPAGLSPNYKMIFENRYTRVYNIQIAAGEQEPQHSHKDRVVVCLSGAQMTHLFPDGREEPSTLKTGETVWRRGGTHIGQNLGKTDLWVIAVEPK